MLFSVVSSATRQPWLYLDPGSGSILLQLLLAGALVIGIFVRTQWARIKNLFTKNGSPAEDTEDDEQL
jgi:hypothetical protein